MALDAEDARQKYHILLDGVRVSLNHSLDEQPWYERLSKSKVKNKKCEHLYRQYVDMYLSTISKILSCVIYEKFVDREIEKSEEWQNLQTRLNASTNQGYLVSFDTTLERNAYTLNFLLKRSAYIMYLFAYAEKGIPLLRKNFINKNTIAVSSFGGGPGFSLIGFFGYILFDLQLRNKNIVWYIFDYEKKWKEQIDLVKFALDKFAKELDVDKELSLPNITVHFATCDVQSPINDVNVNNDHLKNACVKEIMSEFKFDMLLYSYVLVENAVAIRKSDFIFVKETLQLALELKASELNDENKDMSVYSIFLDSTHRLFPDIIKAALNVNQNTFFVPKIRRMRGLPRNVLLILSGCGQEGTIKNHFKAKYGLLSKLDCADDKSIQQFITDNTAQESWRNCCSKNVTNEKLKILEHV
eukprot:g3065.t1